jgi:site-specific DNA recombinase
MTRSYTARANTRSSRGLWPLTAEPGPSFRWGAIKRRSVLNPDGTEGSTARQEDAIYSYVEQHNMGRIVAVYTDIASAFDEKAKRPEFENALDDLRARRIDGIIVWKIDRLTRRRSQARRILTLLEECGGRLVSVVEGIDTADPAKREITDIALAVYVGSAESESEAISERVRLMQYDRARKGLPHRGGERPFGHSADSSELVPGEVEILHEAGRRVLAGEAVFAIARDFTKREIQTTRGATLWHPEVLASMLRSPRMVAMQEYSGKLYDLRDVPPIFEREAWERICAKMEHKPAAPTETHLLSNIALCGICSHRLRSSGSGNPRGRRGRDPEEFAYRCRNKTRIRDDGACGKLQITGSLADHEVNRRVIAWISNRQNVESLLFRYADKEDVAAIQARIAELTESMARLGRALNPPPGVPALDLDVYYEEVAKIEEERKTQHRRLAVTREAGMLTELLEIDDLEAEWNARSVQWRRAILKLVTLSIAVEPRGKGIKGQAAHLRKFDSTRIKIQFAE